MKPNFNINLKDKTLIIPLGMAVVLLIIIFSIAYLAISQSQPPVVNKIVPNTTNTTVTSGDITVSRIVPSAPLPLSPGLPYSFTIYFKDPIDPSTITFILTAKGLYDDTSAAVVKTTATKIDSKTIVVKTDEPIRVYGEYILQVYTLDTNTLIFSKGYLTKDVLPTPIPSNNPALIPYLPHESDAYRLEYFSDRNIYVFHLKYNASSDLSTQEQFDKAKADAIQFMKSHGIDVDSITIEWRYS